MMSTWHRVAILVAALTAAGQCCAEPGPRVAEPLVAGIAERNGGELRLTASNGTTVTLADENGCDDGPAHCAQHTLVSHDTAHRAFIVRNTYYESDDYSWVSDETGAKVDIKGMPHFSPNGDLIAVAVPSECCGFSGLQIWRVQAEIPVLEWQHEPQDYWLFDFVTWRGNRTVILSATTHVGGKFEGKLVEGLKASLNFVGGSAKWQLIRPEQARR